jgi:hypothetical protein
MTTQTHVLMIVVIVLLMINLGISIYNVVVTVTS